MRLRQIREKAQKTQAELAKYLGVSRQCYNNYELGNREPSTNTLIKLSEYFGVSIDYLLENKQHHSALDEKLSEEEFALYGEAHDLTDEEKEKVIDFIRFTKSQRDKNNTLANSANIKIAAKKETPPNPLKDIGRTHT